MGLSRTASTYSLNSMMLCSHKSSHSLINLINSLSNPEPNNIWFRNAFATVPVSALPILLASHEINHGGISWCTTTQLLPPMFSKHHDS